MGADYAACEHCGEPIWRVSEGWCEVYKNVDGVVRYGAECEYSPDGAHHPSV